MICKNSQHGTYSVDLNGIKPSLQGTLNRVCEGDLELDDILHRHLSRAGMVLIPRNGARGVDIIRPAIELLTGNSAGREPWCNSACFPASVAELDHHLLALTVRELDDFAEILDLAVFPESVVFRRDSSVCCDCRGFDARDAGATLNDTACAEQSA